MILCREQIATMKPRRVCASSTAHAAVWSMKQRSPRLLKSGHVAGAAFDVFAVEPANRESRCSTCPTWSVTPHLGAATTEAQENVALQVAEQMSNYLLDGCG